MNDSELSLTEHLEHLRLALFKSGIGMVAGIILCYYFSDQIIHYIQVPLFKALPPDQQKLYFTSPLEKFLVFVKVAVVGGISLSLPLILYQLWNFVAPGLYQKEKNFALPFMIGGTILFFSGTSFAYFIVIPEGLKFLMTLGGSTDGAIITYSAYVNVLLMMMLVMGGAFQVPLIIILGVATGLINVQKLKKARPYVYVFLSVGSALLTPPDPFTMLAMFIPTTILYELTLFFVSWKK